MKPQLSPLVLNDFAIINCNFKFTAPPEKSNIRKIIDEYSLDMDFAIVKDDENTRVFIKVAINHGDNKLPGYSIFAEGVAIFELTDVNSLSEEDKKSLLQHSAVSIAINSLRGFISSLTANAPFGKYILPSIDVNNLFQQKGAKLKKDTQVKKKKITQKNLPK
jgi:preprotein translocase subunit SecB